MGSLIKLIIDNLVFVNRSRDKTLKGQIGRNIDYHFISMFYTSTPQKVNVTTLNIN